MHAMPLPVVQRQPLAMLFCLFRPASALQFNIVRATNLAGHDWWNGLSDPYVVLRVRIPGSTGGGSRGRGGEQPRGIPWSDFVSSAGSLDDRYA